MTYNQKQQDINVCEPHTKPEKILLECGEGTGNTTFTSSNDDPFQLARVTLDTISLNRAEVLIEFSSLVKMERLDVLTGTVRLQYELFRVCDNEEPISRGVWMYEEVNVDPGGFDIQEEPFSFIYCECMVFPRCYDYYVIVTPVEITNAEATVSDGRMAALSQTRCECLKNEIRTSGQKHPQPKEVLLSCGQGNGSVIFKQEINPEPPVNIAHITLDTTYLSQPKVLIEFSSMIKIDFTTDISLQFELFRVCGEGEPLSRGIWTFERTGTSGDIIVLNKIFNFTYCECEALSCCCEYFVEVTPIEINQAFTLANVIVSDARMIAITQSNCSRDAYIDCNTKHPIPRGIILECGEGNGSQTFTSSDDPAFQLAQVSIDTTCLSEPKVNIQFSSIVSFERFTFANIETARLRYELFRVSGDSKPISLGIWMSERIDFDFINRSTNIFNFTYCDCLTCPGCYDYFVKVTPISIGENFITATVSNGRIAALAQSTSRH